LKQITPLCCNKSKHCSKCDQIHLIGSDEFGHTTAGA
jgi:hypothetical protein